MGLFASAGMWRRAFVGVLGIAGACACGQGVPTGNAAAGSGGGATTVLVGPPVPLLRAQAGALTADTVEERGAQDSGAGAFGPGCEPGGLAETGGAAGAEGSCAGVLKEDGLERFAWAKYRRSGDTVPVFALQFVDATGAYSAYTFYQSMLKGARVSGTEARLGKTAGEATNDAAGALVWAGTTVLRVKAHVSREELAGLVAGLPKVGGRRGLAPLLPRLIPGQGMDAASVRYALGAESYAAMGGVLPAADLGWQKSAEVATTTYRGGRGRLTLLLYPTPQIAGDRGRAIEKYVNDAGGAAKFGTVRMRRVGPLVGMTSGEWTAAQAQGAIAGLHLNEEVTFDQKMPLEFHAEVKKTASLLQNIAVLCGVLILAAVLLGLFLGGARAGIRVLLGKPAASEPEFLTINLRDRPKALFTRKGGDEARGE